MKMYTKFDEFLKVNIISEKLVREKQQDLVLEYIKYPDDFMGFSNFPNGEKMLTDDFNRMSADKNYRKVTDINKFDSAIRFPKYGSTRNSSTGVFKHLEWIVGQYGIVIGIFDRLKDEGYVLIRHIYHDLVAQIEKESSEKRP